MFEKEFHLYLEKVRSKGRRFKETESEIVEQKDSLIEEESEFNTKRESL